jgi:hypothetical protein
VQRLLALALVLTSCAGSGSPEVQLDAGDCIAGTAAIENVPCDDPAAEYRLLRPATSIAVPEPGCDDGEVLLQIERIYTEGPLTGGRQPARPWCAEQL